jgi:chaperonin cofactor prefoldin
MKRSKMLRQSNRSLVDRIEFLEKVLDSLQSDNEYMSARIDELESEVVETKVQAFDAIVRGR